MGCNDWVVDLAAHMDRLEVPPVSPSWSLAKNFDSSIVSKIASVYNNASSASGTITAALSGDEAGSFTLNTTSLGTIAAGESGGVLGDAQRRAFRGHAHSNAHHL